MATGCQLAELASQLADSDWGNELDEDVYGGSWEESDR